MCCVCSLQGVLCASVRCGRPREEVDKAWSQISVHCPLLLLSTVVQFVLHTVIAASSLPMQTFYPLARTLVRCESLCAGLCKEDI